MEFLGKVARYQGREAEEIDSRDRVSGWFRTIVVLFHPEEDG